MRSLQLVSHLTDTEIKKKLSQNREDLTYSRWQIIYLIQVGKLSSAEVLAPIVNLSVHSIYKIVESIILKVFPPSFTNQREAGEKPICLSRRKRSYLSL